MKTEKDKQPDIQTPGIINNILDSWTDFQISRFAIQIMDRKNGRVEVEFGSVF